jgi:hypothetical protein
MQLSRLSLADPLNMTWHTKRPLLQLHILFLGLFIEPYRACLVDLAKARLDDHIGQSDGLESMKDIEEQCILAARQSARVASLLQIDNLIRSHCWVSVYVNPNRQSYLQALTQGLIVLGTQASPAARYFSSALRRNYYRSRETTRAKTYYTRPRI